MKYINPIYTALVDMGYVNLAYEWFYENIDFYHPIAVSKLRDILNLDQSTEDIKNLERLRVMASKRSFTF